MSDVLTAVLRQLRHAWRGAGGEDERARRVVQLLVDAGLLQRRPSERNVDFVAFVEVLQGNPRMAILQVARTRRRRVVQVLDSVRCEYARLEHSSHPLRSSLPELPSDDWARRMDA